MRILERSFVFLTLGLFAAGCAQLLDGDHDYRLTTTGTAGAGGGDGGATSSSAGAGGATEIVCKASEAVCGQRCVDLTRDATSCGSCDHDCLGGGCTDGLCDVTVLASGLDFPYGVAVDQTHVYFTTTDGTVQRVLKNGGSPEILAEGLGALGNLVIHEGRLYFANRSARVVQRIAKNGVSGPATLTPQLPNLTQVAADASGVYFVVPFDQFGNGPGSIGRVAPGNLTITWLTTNLVRPNYLFLDSGYAYFSQAFYDANQNKYVEGLVNRMPQGGGEIETLASMEIIPMPIVADAEAVYWGTDDGEAIRKHTFAGGETVSLAAGQDIPIGLAIDGEAIYWATLFDGTIMRASKAGGPPVTLAAGRVRPFYLTVDDKRVYWSDSSADGKILSAPR